MVLPRAVPGILSNLSAKSLSGREMRTFYYSVEDTFAGGLRSKASQNGLFERARTKRERLSLSMSSRYSEELQDNVSYWLCFQSGMIVNSKS
jgi:hypothetical protein